MNMKLKVIAFVLTSSSAFAGAMGAISTDKFFLLEGGLAYDHVFYKDNVTFSESYTPVTPNGFAINPKKFYPNNFFGGYAGLSFYFPSWLLNARYNLYSNESKSNLNAGTLIKFKPSGLSFTADKIFGNFNQFSFGLGGGVVIQSINEGSARINLRSNRPLSESLQGRSHVEPLVEAFIMHRCNNNWGIKLNAEYQISTGRTFGYGDLNINLGINYAFPV
jgi:hypothetical protein